MKTIRNNVFETNSSTTHSLVLFDQIKACGVNIDDSKEVTITLVPLFDNSEMRGEEWQNEQINSLNHVSYMVDYIYTKLMFAKYQIESKWYGESGDERTQELSDNASKLIDKMQKYLVKLGYKITYKQPLVFDDKLSDYRKVYIENNDGSDVEYLYEIEEILYDIDSFKDYITKYTWVIKYEG